MIRRIKIVARLSVVWGALAFIMIAALFVITSVSTKVDDTDRLVFEYIFKLNKDADQGGYENEINAIKKAQHLVLQLAPVGEPIANDATREPADLLKKGSGLCYDRSRTFDKLFKWMGFETRHPSVSV